MLKKDFRFREITYNYTSFSDKEIILKYFNTKTWDIVNQLRKHRITGRSAKLLYENIGDIFIIERNPYLFEEFLNNKKKRNQLKKIHQNRIDTVQNNGKDNPLVDQIIEQIRIVNDNFFKSFSSVRVLRGRLSFALTGITSFKNVHYTPFHRITHATDATDWRVEHPFAVVYPDTISEIPKLIKAAKN